MLKTVSSVANAIGALNYKGTWNANTNTPTLASGVGTQGDYYVVSVAGATDLDGITNWGVGDWAAFNGSVWQRVEGGADGNFVNLDVTGTATVTGEILANGGIALGDNDLVTFGVGDDLTLSHNGSNSYITNTTGILVLQGTNSGTWVLNGSGQAVFKTDANAVILGHGSGEKFRTVTTGVSVTGNVAVTSGNGIDFSATAGTGTSELLDDYEEGTWTPVISDNSSGGNLGSASIGQALYTKIGRTVFLSANLTNIVTTDMTAGNLLFIQGLPFASSASNFAIGNVNTATVDFNTRVYPFCQIGTNASVLTFAASGAGSTRSNIIVSNITSGTSDIALTITYNT